jgi:hypothetical protein
MFRFGEFLLGSVFPHIFGDPHRVEMRTAHATEVRRLAPNSLPPINSSRSFAGLAAYVGSSHLPPFLRQMISWAAVRE